MQAFIDGVATQCKNFGLTTELIIVEWNPPEGRPRLLEVLRLQAGSSMLVRVITVRSSLHLMLKHSDTLPLFQMIAKNVGIRAARGRFVLATNVDILFSNEMVRFLASGALREGRYYRADRYDVPPDVLRKASIDSRLEYCEQNVLRVCKKEATVDLQTGEVHRIYPDSKGLKRIHALFWALGLLLAFDFVRRRYTRKITTLRGRRVRRPAGPSLQSSMTLAWKSFRANWLNFGARFPTVKAFNVMDRLLARIEILGFRFLNLGSAALTPKTLGWRVNRRFVQILVDLLTLPPPTRPWLFTNASGDFTLMARSDWSRLRGYPELELSSLHIDSLLLYNAYFSGIREAYLRYPIYHIEHSKGWSHLPSGQDLFSQDMRQRGVPVLSYQDFLDLTNGMVSQGRGLQFNGPGWGLGDQHLEDSLTITTVHAASGNQVITNSQQPGLDC